MVVRLGEEDLELLRKLMYEWEEFKKLVGGMSEAMRILKTDKTALRDRELLNERMKRQNVELARLMQELREVLEGLRGKI